MLRSTKQGLSAILELLGGPPVSKSQLLTSFTKKLASNNVVKDKFRTIWKVKHHLDFEINQQNQITKKDIRAHAAALLQLCTTLHGADIAALNRSSIFINTKEMLLIAPKRKKRNCFIERTISRLIDKNICPDEAMEAQLNQIAQTPGDDLWFTLKEKRENKQQLRDVIRRRLRQAGVPRQSMFPPSLHTFFRTNRARLARNFYSKI
ncbi:MAG: hypothetical protein EZS28_018098 [Streblomastix strix]|uniref:Tyr recombinase domain-containing protein n=1 Tax=Streblomastix strix TaxID=222440 RepID=A0A5J4VUJ6_9EUKA|nr:MAG: hypothetical protein EZS28_018098 [Streblomastix strix]